MVSTTLRKIDAAGTISTIAGTATTGFSGDGGHATAALLHTIFGIAIDQHGNIYICDRDNYRIRKIDLSGTITTVAGTGIETYNGDSIPATTANIYLPYGICVDALGNIYVSVSGNGGGLIRKINNAGIITTIAGTPMAGIDECSGDGDLATGARMKLARGTCRDDHGNIYVSDMRCQTVRKINTEGYISTITGIANFYGFSGDGGPATDAKLYAPYGITMSGTGDMYICDHGNDRIRKISGLSTAIQTVAISNHLSLYPNPGSGHFNIHIPSTSNEEITVTITNVVGVVVKNLTAHTNTYTALDIDMQPGVYVLTAIGTNTAWRKTMIVAAK